MLFFSFLAMAQDLSPLQLPIGRPGRTVVESGRLTDLATGKAATVEDIAKAADGKRFVMLGEQHATPPDQSFESDVIEALVRRGRHVVVGLEMYQRPKQEFLDRFSKGDFEESAFLLASDWKGQWGFPFPFYRPVFDSVRRHQLPLVGLNVPRDWVRSVGRNGLGGLSVDAKDELPTDIRLDMADHKQVFNSLMGGHSMTGPSMDNMYAAQVLWDEGMADTAIKYLVAHKPDRKTVFVIIAGSGHVMYGQGINLRLTNRKAGSILNVVMDQSNAAQEVSNGLADFVLITPKQGE